MSPFTSLSGLLLWFVILVYSTPTFAHDPGLSLINIEQTGQQFSVEAVYASKDLESFLSLRADPKNESVNTELHDFILDAIEFRDEQGRMDVEIDDIKIDASSEAIHFWLTLGAMNGSELEVKSRFIDRFALGHRQFVKVTTKDKIQSSRILSARDSRYKVWLPQPDIMGVFYSFVKEGIWHIWIGLDHVLFVVTLLLPAVLVLKNGFWQAESGFIQILKQTIKVISAFTIAHSLTLTLTFFQIIILESAIVESTIALSVIIAALNNIYPLIDKRLWLLAFGFGLLHGMGFATVLNQLGMSEGTQTLALLGFNIGVELGQLAIVLLLLPTLYVLRYRRFYQPIVMTLGSTMIAFVGVSWLFARITEVNLF